MLVIHKSKDGKEMLDKYIEKRIVDKITLLNILLGIHSIDLEQLVALTSLHFKALMGLLKELQEDFEEELDINIGTHHIHLRENSQHPNTYYFHQIYNQSTTLKMLRFFILHSTQNFNDFTQDQYISIATGYRIRQKCTLLLRSVGLNLIKNQIIGSEYRIRFLIALLQCHFGIIIYDFSDGSLDWVKQMIVQSNDYLDEELLEATPGEYIHFSTLVALTWKRRDFPLEIPHRKRFEKLTSLFIYPLLIDYCHTYLEAQAQMSFSQNDLDYIFLVYCSTNVAFAKDKWNLKRREHVIQLVLQDAKGKHLYGKFKNILSHDILQNKSFATSMTFLIRSFLFGLQNLVPYYNYYEQYGIETSELLYHISKAVVQEWMTEQQIEGFIDQHRLYLFSLYLTEAIFSTLPPVSIFIFLNNQADVDMIESIILRNFTAQTATIKGYNILTTSPSDKNLTEHSIIITTKDYLPYVQKRHNNGNYHFLPIALDLHISQQHLIRQTIVTIRKEAFDQRVATIVKKAQSLL